MIIEKGVLIHSYLERIFRQSLLCVSLASIRIERHFALSGPFWNGPFGPVKRLKLKPCILTLF